MSQSFQNVLDTGRIVTLLALATAVYIAVKGFQVIRRTYSARRRYQDIPQLPRHPIWGHLINMGEKLNPALRRHPDYAFEEIWISLGRPPAFLMDLHPVDSAFLIVADPALAEEISQPNSTFKYSLPKSDTLMSMYRLIGLESLIIAEGEEWKILRRRFNKGFAPQHLHTLDGLIVSKTRDFIERLKQAAKSRKTFLLKDYAQDLTTDIITTVAIEKDYHAQTLPEGVGSKSALGMLTASRLLSKLVFPIGRGFNPFVYFDPIRPAKSWFYEQVFNRELAARVREQIALERAQTSDKSNGSTESTPTLQRSITRLALSGLDPDAALVRSTVSQIKSFLFAGQDTTATLIQWLCFELSKASWSPRSAAILQSLTAEHDAVFGTQGGPFNALDVLGRTDEAGRKETEAILGSRLPYTTAFIKETLRIHPPAATARLVPEMSPQNPTPVTMKIRTARGEEKDVNVNGLRIYSAQHLIHQNTDFWGPDAHVFRPDRWLDEKYMSGLPTGAWRPFERGPRNCIGQELAMVEAKVVLCAVARGFSWEKVGYSGRKQTEGMEIPRGDGKDDPEREVWSVNQVTSVPVDGMKMRVCLKE
jgi:cytochrome P450